MQEIKEKRTLYHTQKYNLPGEKKEFVSGESLLYLGKYYTLEIVPGDIEGIEFDNKFVMSKSNKKQAQKLLKEWYIRKAQEKLIPEVKHFANHLGVRYNKAKEWLKENGHLLETEFC